MDAMGVVSHVVEHLWTIKSKWKFDSLIRTCLWKRIHVTFPKKNKSKTNSDQREQISGIRGKATHLSIMFFSTIPKVDPESIVINGVKIQPYTVNGVANGWLGWFLPYTCFVFSDAPLIGEFRGPHWAVIWSEPGPQTNVIATKRSKEPADSWQVDPACIRRDGWSVCCSCNVFV